MVAAPMVLAATVLAATVLAATVLAATVSGAGVWENANASVDASASVDARVSVVASTVPGMKYGFVVPFPDARRFTEVAAPGRAPRVGRRVHLGGTVR